MEVAAGSFPFICVFSAHQSRAFVVILFRTLTGCPHWIHSYVPSCHLTLPRTDHPIPWLRILMNYDVE